MLDVAYYHLPDAEEYHVVRGRAQSFQSLPDLEHSEGFVMAPFSESKQTPYVVIPPEFSSVHAVPKRVRHFELRWTERDNRTLYRENFHDLHDLLNRGVLEKVVLSRRVDCKVYNWTCTLEQLFRKACVMYPHQMTVLVNSSAAGIWFLSSPEILVERKDGKWKTMALAGTSVGEKDWTDKEKKEQQLVERYISDTLSPLTNDFEKTGPYTVVAARLLHRRTDFSFSLRKGVSVNDLVNALHPTPAVCGLPKNIALGSIRTYENIDRRYYSGFCGPWNINGTNALYVTLRCMEIDGERDFHLYAGGGLLKESDERSEWQETDEKMNTMRNVLR